MSHSGFIYSMKCIYRFGMYADHALYIRPSYVIESRWSPRVRGMYAVHTPIAPWIRNGQVLLRDIMRSGIAIHAQYVPHVLYPYAVDTQLIRNRCKIVAPEMFHQTVYVHFYGRRTSVVASPASGTGALGKSPGHFDPFTATWSQGKYDPLVRSSEIPTRWLEDVAVTLIE